MDKSRINLSFSELLFRLLPAGISSLGIFYSLWAVSQSTMPNKDVMVSVLLAFLFYIAGEKFNSITGELIRKGEKQKLYEELAKSRKTFQTGAHAVYIGGNNQGLEFFTERVQKSKTLKAVKNTAICHFVKEKRICFDSSVQDELCEQLAEFVKRKNSVWIGVFSESRKEETKYRLRKIQQKIGDDLIEDRCRFFQTKQEFPSLNMVILEYEDPKNDEVIWGWGQFDDCDEHGSVFVSENREIVGFFKNLFRSIKNPETSTPYIVSFQNPEILEPHS